MATNETVLHETVERVIGEERTQRLFQVLTIQPELLEEKGSHLSQAGLAQALNMLLFEDLVERVPDAKLYVSDCLREGRKVLHDHGAVRTVASEGMGSLPSGQEAIIRILRPLGYALNGTYPLERLKMTGRSYAQVDYPETIAQFFVSELYPDRFSAAFQGAVQRVTASSADPLDEEAKTTLDELQVTRCLPIERAATLLPVLVGCFRRQHQAPSLSDYELLLAESAEMAWIATEGNAFNHATDRVADVEKLSDEQKSLGRAMKASVEISQSGRVRQTAYIAARVTRGFRTEEGGLVEREVPGSFYEFITRLPLPQTEGRPLLDLSFDSSNAQAIFQVTAKAS